MVRLKDDLDIFHGNSYLENKRINNKIKTGNNEVFIIRKNLRVWCLNRKGTRKQVKRL